MALIEKLVAQGKGVPRKAGSARNSAPTGAMGQAR
jgi:hypothetical protein